MSACWIRPRHISRIFCNVILTHPGILQIKVEAKADISLEDDRSNGLSPIDEQSHNLSAADEIDLNSDSEYKDGVPDTKAKIELRSEPEDIFEDIPDPKESHAETMAVRPSLETLVTSPRTQV